MNQVSLPAAFFAATALGTVFLFTLEREEAYEAPEVRSVHAPEILFVGDLFFDRKIRQISEEHGGEHLFACIRDLLNSVDAVVGNLEGPITEHASISLGTIPGSPNNFRFTFPTSTAQLLAQHNIKAVSLGNNHIGNFGEEGISSTHDYLIEAGVGFFGGLMGNEPIYRTEIDGVRFSFVAYNEFGGSSPQAVAEVIASEKAAGNRVIVFAHWGDEYSQDVSRLRPIARLFIKSGADAVVGAHPHVVQAREWTGKAPVYYSLGNFIFDQYFSDDVMNGLALKLVFSDDGIEAVEFPAIIGRDGRTCPK